MLESEGHRRRRLSGRLVGQHPDGGPVTVREGRFGPYVNWGRVNATIPKSTPPDSITLSEALELLAEREGKPAARAKAPARAAEKKTAPAKATAGKAPVRKSPAKSASTKAAAAGKKPAPKAAAKKR